MSQTATTEPDSTTAASSAAPQGKRAKKKDVDNMLVMLSQNLAKNDQLRQAKEQGGAPQPSLGSGPSSANGTATNGISDSGSTAGESNAAGNIGNIAGNGLTPPPARSSQTTETPPEKEAPAASPVAPVSETSPATSPAPSETLTPVEPSAPVEASAPSETAAPVQETTPAEAQAPTPTEAAPVTESAPKPVEATEAPTLQPEKAPESPEAPAADVLTSPAPTLTTEAHTVSSSQNGSEINGTGHTHAEEESSAEREAPTSRISAKPTPRRESANGSTKNGASAESKPAAEGKSPIRFATRAKWVTGSAVPKRSINLYELDVAILDEIKEWMKVAGYRGLNDSQAARLALRALSPSAELKEIYLEMLKDDGRRTVSKEAAAQKRTR